MSDTATGQDKSQTLTISRTGWSVWGVAFGKTNSVPYDLEWQLQAGRHLWLLEWPASRTRYVKRKYPDVVRMWRQFHGCPGYGDGIERVFTSPGKQHDDLKKKTMDKTLESTLKSGMSTKLPTCDDKLERSLHRWWRHKQETEVAYGGWEVGRR